MCVFWGFWMVDFAWVRCKNFPGKISRAIPLGDSFARADLTEAVVELDSFSLLVKLYLRRNPKFLLAVAEVAGAVINYY